MTKKNMPDPRNIQYLPLDDLQGDPRNPKAHDIDTIDASINRFGVLDLIVMDERTNQIISGHGRKNTLQAIRDRGETPPEGVQQDKDGNWLVPVVTGWASRSDTEAAAALIAMNRTTELGGWVDESLLELLQELQDDPDGFDGVGFENRDLSNLESALETHDWDNYDEDDLEAALAEADQSAWPVIRIQVDPEIAAAFNTVEGADEYQKFLKLLQLAGVWA